MTGEGRVNEFSSDIYDQIPGKLQFLLVSAVCFVLISKSQHANVVGQDDAHDTLNQVKNSILVYCQ